MTNIQTITLLIAIFGAVTGTLGAVTGVINLWRLFDRDRLKLKVEPAHAMGANFDLTPIPDSHFICITVTNLSAFPITVSGIGFRLHGTTDRLAVIDNNIAGGQRLPQRLESRTSCNFQMNIGAFDPRLFARVRCAYAETGCGQTVEGTSPSLADVVKAAAHVL